MYTRSVDTRGVETVESLETVGAGNEPENRRCRCLPCRVARNLRRLWHRLRARWFHRGVRFVFHKGYGCPLPGVPLDHMRAERILAFLTEESLITSDDIEVSRPASLRNLLRAHSAEYIEGLQQRDAVQRVFGIPINDEILEHALGLQRLMVGGTIQATRLALKTGLVSVNLGGGLHHAQRASGMGFCAFNDVAVAITRLRSRGFKDPVLVIDLDLHDGNGTRAIFADDPTVYTYSVHGEHWGSTAAVASTAIALGPDVSDELYLGTLLKTLPDVVETVRPGLVIYLAGVDPAQNDPMGNWQVTAEGMLSRDRFVIDLVRAKARRIPLAVVLAGGYGDRAWQLSARFFSWLLSGRIIEPPSNQELTLMGFRRIKAQLDLASLTAEPAAKTDAKTSGFDWELTAEDLAGILPGVPYQTRFLDYFSRHGVELVLERFGIFDQLRVRGFRHPVIDLDLGHQLGQMLRIFGGSDHKDLLIELRVKRNRGVVKGREVLVVEWLLLQNPRADFGPYRRPLPGQNHPGLGILKEFFGWLLMVCEMLELDAVYYVPATYHVAGQSRRIVRFLKPEHEARFRVLEELFSGVALAEASRAVHDGEVFDHDSGQAFRWQGFPMVLPLSEPIKALVSGAAYEEQVATELQRVNLSRDGVSRDPSSPADLT